jgi:uncharacterized membrane protein
MPDKKQTGLSDNSLGAIAYITVVPALFFLAIAPYNKSSYVRFHAWQCTALTVLTFIVSLVLYIFPMFTVALGIALIGFSALVWFIWALTSLWCAFSALHGKRIKLPLIGAWAEYQSNR